MSKTVAEKILSSKSGQDAYAGEIVVAAVDLVMASDTTAPIAISSFREMGGVTVARSDGTILVIDHAVPAPTAKIANLHKLMRDFASEQDITLYDCGCGICHQLILEDRLVTGGDLVLGADSHTCTYGAVGAFATGVGATDLAAAMLTGMSWLKVPETIRVNLKGCFPEWICAKDLALYLIGLWGSDGRTYQSIEFYGDVLDSMSMSEKSTICNMLVEMGAKNGFICDSTTKVFSDENAVVTEVFDIHLNMLTPQVAMPHKVENAVDITQAVGIQIDQVFIGSCTNARIEDLRIVAGIVNGKRISKNVRLVVTPASERILVQAMKEGVVQAIADAGGMFTTPGCGLCVGTLGGVPEDNAVVLSTSNRNFKGRMGNNTARIYLASPATAAISAIKGSIADPREVRL